MSQPLHIANAHIYNPRVRSSYDERDLYTTDVVVTERPKNALSIDLSGYTIFPGLVNAHDHLELNHYPRTKYRDRYDNAHQWGEDMNAHLDQSPFKELRAYPLEDRCFIGGLKNLLCGATTVAHHNPPHKCLFKSDFPVRVLKRYGWSHSLHFSTDEEIGASYKSTPPDAPWFIHLAEGTDYLARSEYKRLKALGCVQPNTVFIHGVGLSYEDGREAQRTKAQLVLCPTTNIYLLGSTIADTAPYLTNLLLGSDSRLTAQGDLLDELRAYIALFPYLRFNFLALVLQNILGPRNILGHWDMVDLGEADTYADFIALKHDFATENIEGLVYNARRADLALIVRGGIPQIGDLDFMVKFPHVETIPVRLDDKEKSMNIQLARQVARCTLREPGLELLEDPFTRRRWRFL